jgi:hypothetical protein
MLAHSTVIQRQEPISNSKVNAILYSSFIFSHAYFVASTSFLLKFLWNSSAHRVSYMMCCPVRKTVQHIYYLNNSPQTEINNQHKLRDARNLYVKKKKVMFRVLRVLILILLGAFLASQLSRRWLGRADVNTARCTSEENFVRK